MISLEAIAAFVEEGLRNESYEPGTRNNRLTFRNGNAVTRYEFRIVADTTDYYPPTREGNTVTVYIHGIIYQNGSNIETANGDVTNATLNTSLELAVPVFDDMDDDGNKELVTKVRGILDSFFSKNGNGSINYEGTNYTFGYEYNLTTSGVRQALPMLGDSFMFRTLQTWVFLPNGIRSGSIGLTIGGYSVPWTTLGIMRTAVQESEIPSNSANAAAKNVTASTQLTINVGMTAVAGKIFEYLTAFLVDGDTSAKTVSLSVVGMEPREYQMTFNDVSLNGQIPLYASSTFKLVEVL